MVTRLVWGYSDNLYKWKCFVLINKQKIPDNMYNQVNQIDHPNTALDT